MSEQGRLWEKIDQLTAELGESADEILGLRGQLAAMWWSLEQIAAQGFHYDEKGRRCKRGEVIVADHALATGSGKLEADVIAAAKRQKEAWDNRPGIQPLGGYKCAVAYKRACKETEEAVERMEVREREAAR